MKRMMITANMENGTVFCPATLKDLFTTPEK